MGIKDMFKSMKKDGSADEYVEIDLAGKEEKDSKVIVKLFVLKTYDEVNEILNILREGYTIAVIDIKQLRQKDSIELKRAISKIKKTTDALEGTIAGFGENVIIVTPSFAKIHIHRENVPQKQEPKNKFDMY